jgi:hypothetical protein
MNFMMRCVAVCLCAATATPSLAQPLGTAFTYQGELKAAGVPAAGLHDLRFRLYDASVGGSQVGPTLCTNNIVFADGRFTVELDFLAAFSGQQRFLEVEVRADAGLDCSNLAGFTILGPRQPLTAAPNALFALTSASANAATNSTQLNGQPPAFYRNATNLNAGTIPDARISGSYTSALTLSNVGNSFAGSGSGLVGLNAANISTGTLTDARLSGNVALLSTAQTVTGTKTFSAAPAFTSGGAPFSVTSSTLVPSLNADLLDGLNSSAFLQAIPVPLTLSGTSATHILSAENAATTGAAIGARFETNSVSGYGAYSLSSASTGTNYALFARSFSPSGYAMYANGRVHVSGNFSASVKAFRIDHPADPVNKYLLHYTAESPEIINFYRGVVVLDSKGTAVVELPSYFARINKSPSYSLTAVGVPMPMLHIAAEIDEAALTAGALAEPGETVATCTFHIAGGVPGAKVSWRVEAARNDRWVQQYGAPVEPEKPAAERGRYEFPELYGQPEAVRSNGPPP